MRHFIFSVNVAHECAAQIHRKSPISWVDPKTSHPYVRFHQAYCLLSDAASAHKPNQDRLRDSTYLGGCLILYLSFSSIVYTHIFSSKLGAQIWRTKGNTISLTLRCPTHTIQISWSWRRFWTCLLACFPQRTIPRLGERGEMPSSQTSSSQLVSTPLQEKALQKSSKMCPRVIGSKLLSSFFKRSQTITVHCTYYALVSIRSWYPLSAPNPLRRRRSSPAKKAIRLIESFWTIRDSLQMLFLRYIDLPNSSLFVWMFSIFSGQPVRISGSAVYCCQRNQHIIWW